jgi:hypothetical protein
MKKINLTLLLFTFQFFLYAQTTTRNVGAYDGIHVAGHYEVTLVSGNEGKLELQGAEKDLDQIETCVKNNTLIIKQKGSWLKSRNSKKVSIKVPVEHVSKANLSGSGSIQSAMTIQSSQFENVISGSGTIQLKLDTQTLKGKVTGSGHLVLSGTANQVEFNVTGSGKISAERVNTKDGKASITGSGDIHMYSSNSLEANITGSGDLLCLGRPERQKTNVTGSGDIEIRN